MTNPNDPHVSWHSAATPGQGGLEPQDSHPKPKTKRMIPFDKIHQWAKESYEGGRGQCHFCKDSFSMNYLRLVKLPDNCFRKEFACGKCRHEKNLQTVK
jgi:hypothetical protein